MHRIFRTGQLSPSRVGAEGPNTERLLPTVELILFAVLVAVYYSIGTEIGFRFTPAAATISMLGRRTRYFRESVMIPQAMVASAIDGPANSPDLSNP